MFNRRHPRLPTLLLLLLLLTHFFRCILALLPFQAPVPPPKDGREDHHHQVQPDDRHPLPACNRNIPLPVLPLVAHLQEPLGIVRDDAVGLLGDAPPHHALAVDGPEVDGPPGGLDVAQQPPAAGAEDALLQDVERDIREGQELAGVGAGEADVRDWEGREMLRAEREEFGGPAAEDDALSPGLRRVGRDVVDSLSDQSHYVVRVVVDLLCWLAVWLRMRQHAICLRRTLISSNSHMFSKFGEARYSSKSLSRGIDS